jgi:putative membrane protein
VEGVEETDPAREEARELPTVMWMAAALAGLIHVLFFGMESLWWTRPAVYRRFRSTAEQAEATKRLALNQGFYNLFLAAGTFSGLALIATGHREAGMVLLTWNCASMLGAALVLAASSPQMLRGALIQGLPPLIFMLGVLRLRLG